MCTFMCGVVNIWLWVHVYIEVRGQPHAVTPGGGGHPVTDFFLTQGVSPAW